MLGERSFISWSTVIFTLVTLLHLARLINDWVVTIGGWVVPMRVSWAGLIIAGFLALSGVKLLPSGK